MIMNITKYIALTFIILVVLILFSCKKDELKLQKLEISSETVLKGTTSAQITVNYSYPTNLKRVDGYVSTMSSMAVTNKATAAIDGKTFVVKFQDLEANTTYYYQFEYSNGIDEIFTEVKSFTTNDYNTPTVTTSDVTNITAAISATCGGNVTDDGGLTVTARGVCWSTSPNPTINDSHTTDGAGIGAFTSSLSNLSDYATYYVRAYATNSKGTRYGNQVMFMTAGGSISFTVNGVTFEMVDVAGGTFTMGGTSEQGSDVYDNELPTHSVTLSSFHLGKYEVTQALWQAVMGSNPSYFSGSDQPVEQVSWNDCQEFITQLNQLCSSQLNGKQFTLPTEAQWEYAARGGNQSMHYKYSGNNTIGNVAWCYDNSGSTTHSVGTKSPNELGIYDMSGNVWEWCQDWYGSYSSSSQTNPTGPSSGYYRVYRGGSWSYNAEYCRVSNRNYYDLVNHYGNLGFRLALVQ